MKEKQQWLQPTNRFFENNVSASRNLLLPNNARLSEEQRDTLEVGSAIQKLRLGAAACGLPSYGCKEGVIDTGHGEPVEVKLSKAICFVPW